MEMNVVTTRRKPAFALLLSLAVCFVPECLNA